MGKRWMLQVLQDMPDGSKILESRRLSRRQFGHPPDQIVADSKVLDKPILAF
jgi:hypothetical protein